LPGTLRPRRVEGASADDADELLDQRVVIADPPGQADRGGFGVGERTDGQVLATLGAGDRLGREPQAAGPGGAIGGVRRFRIGQDRLSLEIGEAHLIEVGQRVVLGHHHDRLLFVQWDDM
jgi:hypothetical protein